MSYDEVHLKLATDPTWYNYDPRRGVAQDWLRRKAEANSASIIARSEARSDKALSIAKDANRLASEANTIASRAERWAMYATIAAVIAIIIPIILSQK